eukprot:CAMPEP_0170458594 /NCGR_PEP_ID=MMETSP0123-20130129/5517_1 /TAXON_ID=182087 /ORGANISM="Favella ehrenbergii, Strain Fehren 1" /LENGTH=170 /DNA_ID=CAMNT_0010722805 /DNA_START=238 /DNA_END=750 /DNA_ORIENTATION=+
MHFFSVHHTFIGQLSSLIQSFFLLLTFEQCWVVSDVPVAHNNTVVFLGLRVLTLYLALEFGQSVLLEVLAADHFQFAHLDALTRRGDHQVAQVDEKADREDCDGADSCIPHDQGVQSVRLNKEKHGVEEPDQGKFVQILQVVHHWLRIRLCVGQISEIEAVDEQVGVDHS